MVLQAIGSQGKGADKLFSRKELRECAETMYRKPGVASAGNLYFKGWPPSSQITKTQLEYLAQRVQKLQDLTKKVCEVRIESYLSA